MWSWGTGSQACNEMGCLQKECLPNTYQASIWTDITFTTHSLSPRRSCRGPDAGLGISCCRPLFVLCGYAWGQAERQHKSSQLTYYTTICFRFPFICDSILKITLNPILCYNSLDLIQIYTENLLQPDHLAQCQYTVSWVKANLISDFQLSVAAQTTSKQIRSWLKHGAEKVCKQEQHSELISTTSWANLIKIHTPI